jgi:hypothetical protein
MAVGRLFGNRNLDYSPGCHSATGQGLMYRHNPLIRPVTRCSRSALTERAAAAVARCAPTARCAQVASLRAMADQEQDLSATRAGYLARESSLGSAKDSTMHESCRQCSTCGIQRAPPAAALPRQAYRTLQCAPTVAGWQTSREEPPHPVTPDAGAPAVRERPSDNAALRCPERLQSPRLYLRVDSS